MTGVGDLAARRAVRAERAGATPWLTSKPATNSVHDQGRRRERASAHLDVHQPYAMRPLWPLPAVVVASPAASRAEVASMSTTCPVCERPVTGAVLCQVTTTDLSRRLAEVPAVVAELEITFTRQSVTSAGRDGGKSAETPLPYGAAASDAVRQLTDTLVSWARAFPIAWHPPLVYQPAPVDARTAATHLRRRINAVRQHAMAEKIYDQVTAAIAHAYEVIDREPDLVPAGQCGADLPDGTRCEETLYGDPARSTVRCDVCGASRDLDQAWMLEGARELEWTATEIGAVTPGVTASMVRGYARRGRLIQRGSVKLGPDRRVPTYRVGDILDILQNDPRKETA